MIDAYNALATPHTFICNQGKTLRFDNSSLVHVCNEVRWRIQQSFTAISIKVCLSESFMVKDMVSVANNETGLADRTMTQ